MSEKNVVEVFGINVDFKNPFIVQQDQTRINSSRYSSSPMKEENNLTQSLKQYFHAKTSEDIQHIDQTMLHHRSVSSLRDCLLFAPPPSNVHSDGEEACHEPKKTLFINQFDEFLYDESQPQTPKKA